MTIPNIKTNSKLLARWLMTVATAIKARRTHTIRPLIYQLCTTSALSIALLAHADAQDAARGNRPGGNQMTVAVTSVTTADVPVLVNAVGTVTARNTATVRARVAGQLDKVLFKEGQLVKAGEILAELDARTFQAAYNQQQAQLQRDQAQLDNAQLDLQRYQDLVKDETISKQQADTQAALVRQYQATVAMDRALLANAKLNLDYTRITAPVSGRLGLRQVDVGNLVSTTDANGIVVITQIKPIDVVFAVPEDRITIIVAQLNAGARLPVDALARDGKSKLASGTLSTLDNQIDATTGTIKLKAAFTNEDGALFPNQFVNVRLQLSLNKGAMVVPSAAVQQGSMGSYVYVLKPDNSVSLRTIVTAANSGDNVTVLKGLVAGERVVTDGLDKLRDGLTVKVNSAEAAPSVARSKPADGQQWKKRSQSPAQ